MTTFQDPPPQYPQPQSRRAVRESERGEGQAATPANAAADETAPDFTAFPAAPTPPQQYFSDAQAPRDSWDSARRAPQGPVAPPVAGAPVTGRRSAAAPAQLPTSEPLSYSTQVGRTAAQVPASEPQSFRTRLDARQAEQAQSGEQPSYRVRDFSPEAQRGTQQAQAPHQTQAPQQAQAPQQPVGRADLSYQTEARDAYIAPPAPPLVSEVPVDLAPTAAPIPAPAPVPTAESSIPDWGQEHTLSRRELRAMLAAQEQAASAPIAHETPASVQPVAPVEEPRTYLTSPPPTASDQAPPHLAPAPIESSTPGVFPQGLIPAAPLPPQAPEPATNTALTSALAEFDMLTKDPASTNTGPSKPVGHWSTQADLDDELQVPETTINRRVGSGSTATNALVLPQIPGGHDIRGPLTGTGEIMLTGSIDLPHNLSSSGVTGSLERDGIDSLFDLHDSEVVTTDSQPVRAIRAVSTHPSGHGVTHTIKPKGTKALTALLIAAASMAVVVAGLLIAAFAFNIF